MTKIAAIFAALRYGSSLTDPALWKRRQNTINAVVGLLGAIVVLFPLEISREDLEMVAGGVAVLLGLLNGYLTTATSDKVGLPPKRDADRGSGGDAPRDRPDDIYIGP